MGEDYGDFGLKTWKQGCLFFGLNITKVKFMIRGSCWWGERMGEDYGDFGLKTRKQGCLLLAPKFAAHLTPNIIKFWLPRTFVHLCIICTHLQSFACYWKFCRTHIYLYLLLKYVLLMSTHFAHILLIPAHFLSGKANAIILQASGHLPSKGRGCNARRSHRLKSFSFHLKSFSLGLFIHLSYLGTRWIGTAEKI